MPPLCKGRWQARNEPDGRVVVLASTRLLQPSRLASLGTLPYTGRAGVKCDILLPMRLCISAKPLLDPQTVRGSLFLKKAEQRSPRSAYFYKMTLFFASLTEIASEPKANVGFSSPHGNCFWQYKSNFVILFQYRLDPSERSLFQNAPQAKPRFCAAGLNSCPQGIRAYLRSSGKVQRRAALIVAKCAPQENRTQSRRRTLGFPPLTEIAFGSTKAIS